MGVWLSVCSKPTPQTKSRGSAPYFILIFYPYVIWEVREKEHGLEK